MRVGVDVKMDVEAWIEECVLRFPCLFFHSHYEPFNRRKENIKECKMCSSAFVLFAFFSTSLCSTSADQREDLEGETKSSPEKSLSMM